MLASPDASDKKGTVREIGLTEHQKEKVSKSCEPYSRIAWFALSILANCGLAKP